MIITSNPFCILPSKPDSEIMINWIYFFPHDNTQIDYPVSFNFMNTDRYRMGKVEIRHIGIQFTNINEVHIPADYLIPFEWICRYLSHARKIYVHTAEGANPTLQFTLLKKFPHYKKYENGYIFMKECL